MHTVSLHSEDREQLIADFAEALRTRCIPDVPFMLALSYPTPPEQRGYTMQEKGMGIRLDVHKTTGQGRPPPGKILTCVPRFKSELGQRVARGCDNAGESGPETG